MINIANTLVSGLIAASIVAFLTHHWTEKRERRKWRDQLRLELYLEVVDLVNDNELEIAKRGVGGSIPDVELQIKRLRISHRLKLIASQPVKDAFEPYRKLVFQEAAHPIQHRPKDPDEVVRARDAILAAMAADVQNPKG